MTQISSKVTDQTLDIMFNNFTKMTDWVINGEESQYPMPAPYKALFEGARLVKEQQALIAEQSQVIAGLQETVIKFNTKADTADKAISNLNEVVQSLLTAVKEQADTIAKLNEQLEKVQAEPTPRKRKTKAEKVEPISETTPVVTPEPVATPEPSVTHEPVMTLADLDSVVSTSAPSVATPVSPMEQAIQVTAQQVNAGELDPTSYQALDSEIASLLG